MEPEVLGDASHVYRGWHRETLFDALTVHRGDWIVLLPGEVLPDVLEAERPDRVVWASFWPAAVADSVELLLKENAGDTTVRWVWHSPTPPDDRGIGISRQRLNTKLGGDIRGWLAHLARSDRSAGRHHPVAPPILFAWTNAADTVRMDERCGICDRPVVKVGDRWFHADTAAEDHAAVWLNEDHPADPWIES